MAGRKDISKNDLTVRLKDDYIVQKSAPLQSMKTEGWTMSEYRILDTYLSKINSHNPEDRTVVFEKGEFEKLLGVTKINKADLEKQLDKLMINVKINDKKRSNNFAIISLFSKAVCTKDDGEDFYKIELKCTDDAMKYIFNIDEWGYISYKLRSILKIKSYYSYVLFLYLESIRFKIEKSKNNFWEVSIEELKHILGCENEKIYEEFKYFKQRILEKCKKEIEEQTELRYSYDVVKKGRKVVAIKFQLDSLAEKIENSNDENKLETIESDNSNQHKEKETENTYSSEETLYYASACDCEFKEKEICYFITILIEKGITNREQKFNTLQKLYAKMNTMKVKNNRYGYFETTLKNYNPDKDNGYYNKKDKVTFSNYADQRPFDPDAGKERQKQLFEEIWGEDGLELFETQEKRRKLENI